MGVPVVFSTGSLYTFGLDRVYGWAAETGYDGVEVMMDDRWDTHQEGYLKHLVEKHGIHIVAVHPPLGRGAWGLEADETLIRAAGLAARVGAKVVPAHPPPPGKPLERWNKEVLARAREEDVTVAVENMPRDRVKKFFTVRERHQCYLPEQLAGLGDLTVDTSHYGASRVDIIQAFHALGDRVRHVHLSDSRLSGRDEHRLPGQGKLPLKYFLSLLGSNDYPGAVCLELKPWPLGAPDPEKILFRMRTSLEFVREGLASGTPRPTSL